MSKQKSRGLLSALLQQLSHQRRPSSLMAGAQPSAGISVEILVEENEIPPIGVFLKKSRIAENRAPPVSP
jgi:Rod binding domain-containing protein